MGAYMNFNPEITLGNILTIAAFVTAVAGAFYGLKSRMDVFQVMIQQYADNFAATERRHEQRLTKLEDNDARLTGIVQELIGQNAERIRWDGHDRRDARTRRERQ